MLHPRIICLILGLCIFNLAHAETVDVSVEDYNRFVLPEPFTSITFPPGTPLRSQPIPMSENRSFMILLKPSARKPLQMVVELKSGESFELQLRPRRNIPGTTFRYKGATGKSKSDADQMHTRATDQYLVKAFQAVVQDETPEGFSRSTRMQPSSMGPIQAQPIATWRSPAFTIQAYTLTSNKAMNIEPPDFYREGVVAVLLESDIVSPQHSPRIFVMMGTK